MPLARRIVRFSMHGFWENNKQPFFKSSSEYEYKDMIDAPMMNTLWLEVIAWFIRVSLTPLSSRAKAIVFVGSTKAFGTVPHVNDVFVLLKAISYAQVLQL